MPLRLRCLVASLFAVTASCACAQTPIQVTVDAGKVIAPYKPIWNNFGADEPNYSYAPNGTRLLRELSAIEPSVPVYFRPHNLLTTGDGAGSLKWGSTNVYSEDANGKPVYDWTITDRLFDNLQSTHVRPMVEIGFMPEALSPHPEPYRHEFPKGDIFTGWSYPPKDYARWRALIVAYATHLQRRYGAAVDTWKWEVWNEPDIQYFHGTVEEYEKLYDITTAAIRQVLPHAIVGGPGVTGGGDNKHFLQLFLEHCLRGTNADSGKPGAPLDFISYHPKGSPKFADGHVTMNLGRQLALTERGMQTIASFPEYRNTPIILTETDPEGCAACQGPQNGYRNGPLYGVSVAEMLARSAELARIHGVKLDGAVTWAFEFENQPYFAGFRDLASNGIDKPVLNVFRMFGKLSGSLVALTSSGALPVDAITKSSVTGAPDVNGIATRDGNKVSVLLWNYHDEDVETEPADVLLKVSNLAAGKMSVSQYRMDKEHSNAYSAWLAMGSPQSPTAAQIAELRAKSGLQRVEMPVPVKASSLTVSIKMPRQAVELIVLESMPVDSK
jgi:xylan 1,4-beta-xylosidase